jgi:hypothetical protein
VSVGGDLAGSWTANSINALSSITGAAITLNEPFAARATGLNRLAVRGAISGANIRANADIGTVSAASIIGSTIYAGVTSPGNNLPATAAAFVNAATIRNVTIRNRTTTPAFADSNIAASTIGRANLGLVQIANAAEEFGLAAQTVRSLSAVAGTTAVRESQMDEPAESLDLTDFDVRIF